MQERPACSKPESHPCAAKDDLRRRARQISLPRCVIARELSKVRNATNCGEAGSLATAQEQSKQAARRQSSTAPTIFDRRRHRCGPAPRSHVERALRESEYSGAKRLRAASRGEMPNKRSQRELSSRDFRSDRTAKNWTNSQAPLWTSLGINSGETGARLPPCRQLSANAQRRECRETRASPLFATD